MKPDDREPNEPNEPDERLPDDRLLEELRPALDAWAAPGASRAFRDDVRARFLSGALDAGSAGELAPALAAYAPRPRGEFRARARRAFLADAAAEHDAPEELPDRVAPPSRSAPAAATPRAQGSPRAPRAARATRTRFRVLVGGAAASVAAAAALVIWLLQPGSDGPAADGAVAVWRVEAAGFSPAGVSVDGVPLDADAGAGELGRRLRDARRLRAGSNALRLVLGEQVAILELGPGSELDLTGVPADPRADLHFAGDEGAFRIATGDGFRRGEQRLSFRARTVAVEVVGTIFGVDVYGEDVCVCCCQGTVRVRAEDESVLAAGETRYVHADGRSDYLEDVQDHQEPLRALRDYRDALPPLESE